MLNFDWLADVPDAWARAIVLMVFIIPLAGALLMPHDYVYLGAPDDRPWRNLKLWVVGLSLIQITVYLYF